MCELAHRVPPNEIAASHYYEHLFVCKRQHHRCETGDQISCGRMGTEIRVSNPTNAWSLS